MASDARLPLKLIAQTMQKYTHICLSVKVRIFECTVAVINMSVCVGDARLFDRFFRSLCVCMCDNLLKCCFRFAFVCVSICREESFALQLMGSIHSNLVFFRNQENK